jgi:hypothetical protein
MAEQRALSPMWTLTRMQQACVTVSFGTPLMKRQINQGAADRIPVGYHRPHGPANLTAASSCPTTLKACGAPISSTTNIMLEHLRHIRSQLDVLRADVHDMRVRLTNVEKDLVLVNRRLDRVDERLDRIEGRLDLVETPAAG